MQYAERYIQTAEKIIINYDGNLPLHHHLKQFFAADKKYGSKDRKQISHACYCFYRLGKALAGEAIIAKIKAGIFLCDTWPGKWEAAYDNKWLQHWDIDLTKRVEFIKKKYSFTVEDIFPFADHLSSDLDKAAFITSHLIQPDLYLRIRPGKHSKVESILSSASIQYDKCGDDCIALPNATKVNKLLQLNKDVVVQDLSSQRIAEFLSSANSHLPTIKIWDCCAASGGKSILAVDVLKNVDLTVSDVRASIIQNLKKRLVEAGIKNYKSFIADLTTSTFNIQHLAYDLIIFDAPCSGSGTWSRTPEQLTSFTEEKISYYSNLQRQILKNITSAVFPNRYLLYITCSVFKEENEDVVEFIKANSSLQLQRMELLEGYDKKADTMFAALFKA
jgi:16S rRNA (cytosine967-C5)-methyltransferase